MLHEWSVGCKDRRVEDKLTEFMNKLNTRFRLKETALRSRTLWNSSHPVLWKFGLDEKSVRQWEVVKSSHSLHLIMKRSVCNASSIPCVWSLINPLHTRWGGDYLLYTSVSYDGRSSNVPPLHSHKQQQGIETHGTQMGFQQLGVFWMRK